MVEYWNLKGGVRWGLILSFKFLKAGLIVSIFMHLAWERKARKVAIILTQLALLVLVILMTYEADYTFATRIDFFGEGATLPEHHP